MVAKNTATLEVTPRQSEQIAQAQQLGTLSMILRPLRDAKIEDAPTDQKEGGSVTLVRYGQSSRISAR